MIYLLCESDYRQTRGTYDDEGVEDMELAQMEWVNTFFAGAPPQEEVCPSQMGAPHVRFRTRLRVSRHQFLSWVVDQLERPFHRSH